MFARLPDREPVREGLRSRQTNEGKPVEIGLLQRFATDAHFAAPGAIVRTCRGERAAASPWSAVPRVSPVRTGWRGSATQLVLFEARAKLWRPQRIRSGPSYKTTGDFAQKEIDWLLSISGGIEVRCGQLLGRDITLDGLCAAFDAVFIGLGLSGVNALGISEPQLPGLVAAVDFIADIRARRPIFRPSPSAARSSSSTAA